MEKEYIVIIVLLCVLIVCFLAIVVGIVVAAAKVHQVTQPIRNVVNTVRKVKRSGSKLKKGVKTIVSKAKAAAPKIRSAIRSDLKQLRTRLKKELGPKVSNIPVLIKRGLNILSGEPCAKFEQLWANHINWTYYYGLITLSSPLPLTPEQKEKADWTAGQLLGVQDDLSKLMSSCVTDNQKTLLNQLFRDHILIVAQMAARWKQQPGAFDATLVQAWYKNAKDTVDLLQSRTGATSDALRKEYNEHLDVTAKYLSTIAAGKPQQALQEFAQAFSHVPMLAQVFCNQMQTCLSQ